MRAYLSRMPVSLAGCPCPEALRRILGAALDAVDPAACVRAALERSGDALLVHGNPYRLSDYRRIFVIGMGKAALPMAESAVAILGERFTEGVIVVKEGHGLSGGAAGPARLRVREAAHPLPDERGVSATREILALVNGLNADDLVVCVVSGGGSALFTSPVAGLSLNDLQAMTHLLLGCGASITEINTLRKCLDEVKGGGLARAVAPAQLIALVLSDVVSDPLDIIASGPTVLNHSTPEDARLVLEKYHLLEKTPGAVVDYITQAAGTPVSEPAAFSHVQNAIVGSNRLAARAALRQAEQEGFHTLLLTTYLQGEARVIGGALAAVLQQIAADGQPLARPACIVAGGETTVTLRGDGRGGRNQELALAAAPYLSGLRDVLLLTLATDGGDGPTDAAGAVVSGETQGRATDRGLNIPAFLARNDSYAFFEQLDDLMRTGATRTNVNDLTFLFAF